MNIKDALEAIQNNAAQSFEDTMNEAGKGLEDPQAILDKFINSDPHNAVNKYYLTLALAVCSGQVARRTAFIGKDNEDGLLVRFLHAMFLFGYKAGRKDALANGFKFVVAPEDNDSNGTGGEEDV